MVRLVLVTVLAAAVAGFLALRMSAPMSPDGGPIRLSPSATSLPLTILILQGNEESQRLMACDQGRCRVAPVPVATSEGAVTDGKQWYAYEDEPVTGGSARRRLVIFPFAGGERRSLLEETDLTRPRDLILSPDGEKLAFFLDNVRALKQQLTELWVYEADSGSTRVVAERLFAPDVRSHPRWNSHSTHLFFVADSGERAAERDQLELIVVDPAPAGSRAFTGVSGATLTAALDTGQVDLDATGHRLAFSVAVSDEVHRLVIVPDGQGEQRSTISGQVVFLQWLDDGSLLYVRQAGIEYSLWRVADGIHTVITRGAGDIHAARATTDGHYLTLVVSDRADKLQLVVFDLSERRLASQTPVPPYGDRLRIVSVRAVAPAVAGTASVLTDDQLTRVVTDHLARIVGAADVTPYRITVTDAPNTVYVDYRLPDGSAQRVLVTIEEAAEPRWQVLARYHAQGAQWQLVSGGGGEPQPVRLYEWEASLQQWIRKR